MKVVNMKESNFIYHVRKNYRSDQIISELACSKFIAILSLDHLHISYFYYYIKQAIDLIAFTIHKQISIPSHTTTFPKSIL